MFMRVGILTEGSNGIGFNAIIYGALLHASQQNIELVGIFESWKLFEIPEEQLTPAIIQQYTQVLNLDKFVNLHKKAGTILYCSQTTLLKSLSITNSNEEKEQREKLLAASISKRMKHIHLDALIAIGGEQTILIANLLFKHEKTNIIVCPQLIDVVFPGFSPPLGFISQIQKISDELENIKIKAKSYQKISIISFSPDESGWLSLYSGLGAGSDLILFPNHPFNLNHDLVEIIKHRVLAGNQCHIVLCPKGAFPSPSSVSEFKTDFHRELDLLRKDKFGGPILKDLNMGPILYQELRSHPDLRSSYLQMGKNYEISYLDLDKLLTPKTSYVYDRILGLRYGWNAVEFLKQGKIGVITTLKDSEIYPFPLQDWLKRKFIDDKCDLVAIYNTINEYKQKS